MAGADTRRIAVRLEHSVSETHRSRCDGRRPCLDENPGDVSDMRKAGVKFLAGSDLPVGKGVPPIHDELVALVGAGMTPMDALQVATRNAAEFLGRLGTEGTIEVGKNANLVLLDASPVTDISNTRRVTAVIRSGRLITAAESLKMR